MKEQLLKALKFHDIVEIVYMAKDGQITKRRIKLLKIASDTFQAYCYTRRAKRTFVIKNVLAIRKVISYEKHVV